MYMCVKSWILKHPCTFTFLNEHCTFDFNVCTFDINNVFTFDFNVQYSHIAAKDPISSPG